MAVDPHNVSLKAPRPGLLSATVPPHDATDDVFVHDSVSVRIRTLHRKIVSHMKLNFNRGSQRSSSIVHPLESVPAIHLRLNEGGTSLVSD